jgi:hypothetical protein
VGVAVVFVTDQDEVCTGGLTAVAPVVDVVDLAPAGGALAARGLAMAVTRDDEGPKAGADDPGPAADVNGLAPEGEDRQEDAVAAEPTGGADPDRAGPRHPRGGADGLGDRGGGAEPTGTLFVGLTPPPGEGAGPLVGGGFVVDELIEADGEVDVRLLAAVDRQQGVVQHDVEQVVEPVGPALGDGSEFTVRIRTRRRRQRLVELLADLAGEPGSAS